MDRKEIFKAIEANSGESIEESQKNGIVAHQVDVDGLIDDILKASNGDLDNVSSFFKYVDDEEPPCDRNVLAVSPEGRAHVSSWRGSYKIFTCQHKFESSIGWKWLVF